MISRLLVAFALISSLFVSASGQTCAGAGFDLSSANVDLAITTGGYNWTIRACGVVNTNGAGACVGNVCQGGTLVSTYDPQSVTWFAVPGGVVQSLANGATCGTNGPRRSIIFFQCNATATTPFITSLLEPQTCQYNSTIQTAAACTPTGNTAGVFVGASRASQTCGGGFADLTNLNSSDIRFVSSNGNYSVRLCGQVADSACSGIQPSSVCQVQSGGTYNLATYRPASYAPVYTVTSNGLNMVQQTGLSCGNFLRLTNVSLSCNQSATTPVIISVTEPITCRYFIAIQTNQVCNILSPVLIAPSSSSTGSVIVVPTTSSSSTGVANVTVISSSSAVVVGNVTGSSSSSGGVVVVVPSSSSSSAIPSASASSSSSSAAAAARSSSSSSAAASVPSSSSSSAAASVPSSSSSSAALGVPSSSSSSAAVLFPAQSSSSSSVARVNVASSSSSSTSGLSIPSSSSSLAVLPSSQSSSSSSGENFPPPDTQSSSSSATVVVDPASSGVGTPPTIVNGAGSFSPSIIALIVAIIVAIVGQF